MLLLDAFMLLLFATLLTLWIRWINKVSKELGPKAEFFQMEADIRQMFEELKLEEARLVYNRIRAEHHNRVEAITKEQQ